MQPRHSIADACLICSGPLHDTWLGSAVATIPALAAIALLLWLYVRLSRWWWSQ